jgi:hypothetical protein
MISANNDPAIGEIVARATESRPTRRHHSRGRIGTAARTGDRRGMRFVAAICHPLHLPPNAKSSSSTTRHLAHDRKIAAIRDLLAMLEHVVQMESRCW